MKPADDFHDLGHGEFEWSAFDPAVKVDLHAHALATAGGQLFFIDPIPLRPAALDEMLDAAGDHAKPAAVLLTNGNHARAADAFRRRFRVPVLAAPGAHAALAEDGLKVDGTLGDAVTDGLRFIPLSGFAPGETVVHDPADGGTLRVGDALIHLPAPYGFSILPAKYCAEPKEGHRSLRALLDHPFERLLFAHGTPILAGARGKLEALLAAAAR